MFNLLITVRNNIQKEGGYRVEMENDNEDDEPDEHKRINTSNSFLFQSFWVQRAVCYHNECHTFILAYCLNFLLRIWRFIYNLFYFETQN